MDISTNLIIAIVVFAVLLLVLWYFSRRADSGDPSQIESIRQIAGRGDVYSQFRLGQLYYEGKGVNRDDAEAAAWFLKAAEQDHAEAQFILATMYEKGTGVHRSDEDAFRWYLQAATQGHERASVILSADKWNLFKQRHLAGDEGPHVSREAHRQEDEDHPRPPQAHESQLEEYLEKARSGDVDAQYNLGIMYYHGDGVEKDHHEALKWFHLSAEQGDADAQFNLGFMYGRGEGAAKDHRSSMEWFQKAASQGHAGARDILEKMFRKS
ncbi:MAG TPA: tetratricopeptide repeat protein [Deltaproteobacteria bacterium]|nr:tetratricopeptide repeat protein [Deltaproteobacteria bacterium]HQI82804.1 tetratricopeptide repeat protein [Deltaproteobacteria bacterium]